MLYSLGGASCEFQLAREWRKIMSETAAPSFRAIVGSHSVHASRFESSGAEAFRRLGPNPMLVLGVIAVVRALGRDMGDILRYIFGVVLLKCGALGRSRRSK